MLLQGNNTNLQGTNPYLQGGYYNPQQASSPVQNTPTQTAKSATPSATSPVSPKQQYIRDLSGSYGLSGGTVYDKSANRGLSLDEFKTSSGISNPNWNQLKFDTAYRPPSLSTPTANQYINQVSQPQAPQAQVSQPKSAYLEYLRKQFNPDALNMAGKNLSELNQRTNEELLRARAREDELRANKIGQVESGLNYGLSENARLSNKSLADLALAKGYANDEYNRLLGYGSNLYSLEQQAQDRATKTLSDTAPALLSEFENLGDKTRQDAYVRAKANELGLSIDQVNSALQGAIATRQANQAKNYMSVSEGEAVFDPATGEFIYKNPKTYNPSSSSSTPNSYGLTNQQIDNISPIANAFRNEQIVQNYNILSEAHNFVKSIPNNTTNPSDDQALVYSLAKALDPNSVVREGEYATVQKYAQSLAQQYGKSVTQALNGTGFLSQDARNNIKRTIEERYNTSLKNYQNVYNEYTKRINNVGGIQNGADFLTNYGAAYQDSSNSPDDFINQVLGFNGVGNTTASTGQTRVMATNTQPKPVLRVTNATNYPLAMAVNNKYPEGSVGGQCGDYARKVLASFGGTYPPLGNSLQSKLSAVNRYGSPINTARLGSIVVTKENPTYGHVAVVVGTTPQGVIVTESNFKQSNKVDTGRVIPWNKLAGVINPTNKA